MRSTETCDTSYPFDLEVRSEPVPNFAVLTGFEFLNDFRLEGKKASKRVWGQAMSVQAVHPVGPMFYVFEQVAKRGLDARMNIDSFSLQVSQTGINWVGNLKSIGRNRTYHRFSQEANKQAFESLEKAGVHVIYTNPPISEEKVVPFVGRNHIKMYIVDDVAWIGGVNIDDTSFKNADFMVKITDPEVVDTLSRQFTQVNEDRPAQDYQVNFKDGSSLLVDSGRKNESLILDTAIQLVSKARKSVKNTSFFTPDGKFLQALYLAHRRGVDVSILTPREIEGILVLVDRWNKMWQKIKRQKIPFKKYNGGLHAKLLIVDNNVALFGSHNLMRSGVGAATEELSFLSRNPVLIANLNNFFSDLLWEAR